MKLEDIQSAVKHAAESELKRSYYNACAVLSEVQISKLLADLHAEVYEHSETDSPAI